MSDIRIENAICQAIDILTSRKIEEAPFDKTIRATIVEQNPDGPFSYLVAGQGTSQFIAYAQDSSVDYPLNSIVYVLIPGNNTGRQKLIIGGGSALANQFKSVSNGLDITLRGEDLLNCNINKSEGLLSSYKPGGDQIYLYQEDSEENIIDVDNQIGKDNIKDASDLVLTTTFRTNFADTQINGQYGVQIKAIFIDENEEQVIKNFVVSSRDITGNPYRLLRETEAVATFSTVGLGTFDRIESIRAYIDGFSQDAAKSEIKDLYITNVSFQAANIANKEQVSPYTLTIEDKNTGRVLDENHNHIDLKAVLKFKGKPYKSTENIKLQYYWFIQDAMVTFGMPDYNSFGGRGWRCLNSSLGGSGTHSPFYNGNIIFIGKDEEGTEKLQKQASQNNISIFNMLDKQSFIKCVCNYGDGWITSEALLLTNKNDAKYDPYIVSSDQYFGQNQTTYYLGIGSPTLKYIIDVPEDEKEDRTFQYAWQLIDNRGNAITSEQPKPAYVFNSTSELLTQEKREQELEHYQQYKRTLNEFLEQGYSQQEANNITKDIVACTDQQIVYWKYLDKDEYYIDNVLYNVNIKRIHVKSTYLCGARLIPSLDSDKNIIKLPTASITFENKVALVDGNEVFLQNGTQVFHYDENGISPASITLQKPIQIKPLTFTWVNPTENSEYSASQLLSEAAGGRCIWYLPAKDTFLRFDGIVNENTNLDETGNYYIIENRSSIPYSIIQNYDNKLKNNNIKLHVILQDNALDVYSDFTFAKDGDPGTNGTSYASKIIPKDSSTDRLYLAEYTPTGEMTGSILYDDNGNSVDNLIYKLYENSSEINVGAKDIKWSILGDKNNSFLKLTPSTENKDEVKVELIKSPFNSSINTPYDIVRAQVEHNGFTHYAEYPINVSQIIGDNSGVSYRIKLAPKSGFKYAVYTSDGRTPRYDNTLPFEVIIEKIITDSQDNGYWVKTDKWGDSVITYTCQSLPIVKEKTTGQIKDENQYFHITQTDEPNKFTVVPHDTFDGEILNVGLLFTISADGEDKARLYVPIYLSLNRYGNAAINAWDGNSIDLGSNGTILAPQVGAGSKDEYNQFTGVLMGKVKREEDNEPIQEEGLFGYNQGQRTIFLDAGSGKAEFGKTGSGQIVIDPRNDKAQLYSGNYDTNKGTGMLIDLTEPEIKFGSGNFAVNSEGHLTAKGGGNIAGWRITDDALYSPGDVLKLGTKEILFKAPSIENGENGSSTVEDIFKVNSEPVYTKKPKRDQNGNIVYQKNEDGIDKIDEKGEKIPVMEDVIEKYTGKAQIAGWKFDNKQLQSPNGNLILGNSTVVFKDGKGQEIFKADDTGAVKIGKWIAEYNRLKSSDGKIVLDPAGSTFSGNTTIGGWTVNQSSIESNNTTGSKLKLNAEGSLTGGGFSSNGTSGWAIRQDGSATFTNISALGGKISNLSITGAIQGTGWSIGPSGINFPGIIHMQTSGSGNDISRSVSMGGGSAGVTSSGTPYFNPGVTRTSPTGQLWQDYIDGRIAAKEVAGNRIFGGTFQLADRYDAQHNISGNVIFSVVGSAITFSPYSMVIAGGSVTQTTTVQIGGLKLSFNRGMLINVSGSFTPSTGG